MLLKKNLALLLCAAWLAGCSSANNLYAQPVAEFASAVEQTSDTVKTYAALKQRLKVSSAIANAAVAKTPLGFSATDCDPAKPVVKCQITIFGTDTPLIRAAVTRPSAEVELMGKMQVYIQLLVSIAGAASEEELLARQQQAEASYADFSQGVGNAKTGNYDAAKTDLKDAIVKGLGSFYLENKRIGFLKALVVKGDPVVARVADTLASFSDDFENQFIINQRGRVGLLVDNFDVLGTAYRANMGGLETARYQALRHSVLVRATSESAVLQTVLATTPKDAFVGMKQAHLALLRALTLADSDLGKAIVAIENFSAAARKASGAVSELKGMM